MNDIKLEINQSIQNVILPDLFAAEGSYYYRFLNMFKQVIFYHREACHVFCYWHIEIYEFYLMNKRNLY